MPTYVSKSSRELTPTSSTISPEFTNPSSPGPLQTDKEPTSKVVEGLTHSQGSIALISALLSGFAFQALTTLTIEYDDLENDYKKGVYIAFIIVTSLTIASFLYVAVACSLLEQNGLIVRSLAMSPTTSSNFDIFIERWYFEDKKFVAFRHQLIHLFISSFVLFSLFCSLFCLVRVDGPAGYASSSIFLIFGLIMTAQVSRINARFVKGILKNV
ncbi:hypothetical protein TrCOL_g187 [Triparma columacea]|uniref:Transmembrane protein n=1 Tax=Triparma columacea TaxID=722753 RepID=A0A9W7LAF5_9STRA|nr:hypothetical protein TrCOL_g187 [Triparma columacea]